MEGTSDTTVLAERAAQILGLTKVEAVNYALRLLLQAETRVPGADAKTVLSTARELGRVFTMENLLDVLFQDEPIFTPHGTKIRIARILTASGYTRKQVRQKGKRPLVWTREKNHAN